MRDRLLKAATGTFGLRLASAAFSFIISVLLARLLGAAGYGTYSYVLAWITLLAVPALVGLDRLIVREIAVYRTQSEWHLVRGLLCWANRIASQTSLALALMAAGVIWIFADRLGFGMSTAFCVGLVMLPLVTLLNVRQAALQGLNHVVVALLPDFFVRPLSLMALLGCAYLFLGTGLNPQWALGLNTVASGLALLIGTSLLHRMIPQLAREVSPAYQTSAWLRSALPMMLISGMHVINHRTDTLMLGAMTDAAAVGVYNVANRGAQLILLIQTAANVALAPTIASLYGTGKMQQLQRVVTKSTQVLLPVSLLVALALVVCAEWFLSLFGSEFIQGRLTLTILAAGCVVNAAAGTVSLLLIMCGHERDAAIGVGVGVVLNVTLNAALIPKWGVEGAAVATSVSMMARNLLMALLVYKKLGLHSTFLGRISLNTNP